jgi:transcription initiation factor IIF auxiliary subunit
MDMRINLKTKGATKVENMIPTQTRLKIKDHVFSDLGAKLVARFSTNIPAKKISMELFGITQQKGESTPDILKKVQWENV